MTPAPAPLSDERLAAIRDNRRYSWRPTLAETDELLAEVDRLRAENGELRLVGGLMSNVAYNIAQLPTMDDTSRRSLDKSRLRWDELLGSLPAASRSGARQ